MPSLEIGKYQHAKTGNFYEVMGVAMHSETHEPLVVYRPLYESKYAYFVRPFAMFTEKVTINGVERTRFEKVSE